MSLRYNVRQVDLRVLVVWVTMLTFNESSLTYTAGWSPCFCRAGYDVDLQWVFVIIYGRLISLFMSCGLRCWPSMSPRYHIRQVDLPLFVLWAMMSTFNESSLSYTASWSPSFCRVGYDVQLEILKLWYLSFKRKLTFLKKMSRVYVFMGDTVRVNNICFNRI